MAGRISGRLMSLMIGAEDRSDEVSKCEITEGPPDNDFLSMKEASEDKKQSKLALTIAQDLGVGTLHRDIIDNAGDSVAFVFAPYGNAVASATEPHITGMTVIRRPEGAVVGGETSNSAYAVKTIEVLWDIPAGWALDDGTP